MFRPTGDEELAKAQWLRDHAEEVAASLPPGDIRTAARLRHRAVQLIDLLDGRFPPRR